MSGYGTNDIEASPKTGGPYGKNDIAAGDKPSGVLSRAADFGIDALKGAIELPEAGVGLADLVTGGYAGKAAEGLGFRPKEAKDYLNTLYSPERQAANQEVQQAQGFLPTVGAMVKNPSTIIGSAVESAPSMLGAGGIARGVMKYAPALSPIIAGAAGEGAVSAGQNAEQVRQEDPNGTLTAGQSAILAGSGALTGAIGAGAGKFANKLGIGDVETMLASGKLGPVGEEAAQAGAKKGLLRKAGEGFATEGALQELPQSYQEQVAQNLAQGKPWDEGAAAAGAQGLLVGGAMGGGGAVLSSEGHTAPEGNTPADAAPYSSATDDRPESVNYQRNQLALDEQPPEVAPQFTPLEDSEISARQAAYAKQAWVAQQNTNRATETPDDEIYRSVGGHGQESAPLSQQMGLDPAAGPMSAAAALAVDSGAHQSMLQQAAQGQEKSGEKWHADTVDSSTGEVDRSAELQGRLDFLNQQAKVTGWNKPMVDQRDQIQSELASAPAQQGALDLGPTAASTTTQKPSIPAAEKGISSPSTTSLQEQSNGTQAAQAQQAVPQPAQAGTTAQPGAVTNAAPTANPLKKAGPATSQEAQTQSQAPQDPGVQWNALPPEQRGAVLTQSGSWNTKSGALNVIGKRLANASWEDIPEKAKNALQGVLAPTQALASPENTAAQSPTATPQAPARQPMDLSGRTDQQLEYLTQHGQPGYKEAAISELENRKAQKPVGATPQDIEASGASSATAQESLTAQTDAAAHEAATSPQNNKPSPTPAQIEAGNYEKGHIQIHGLDITVENPRGSVRSGKREDGSTWSHEMSDHYGYIRRTTGADGEQVDVYVGPKPTSGRVFVVDQLNQQTGGFDEHKAMLGYSSKESAVAAYRKNFDKGWKVGPVQSMTIPQFKAWLKNGDTTKPISAKESEVGTATNAEAAPAGAQQQEKESDHGLQKRRREGQVAPANDGQGVSGGKDSPAAAEKEAPRDRGVLAKAKEAQAAKLAKATEILGANVGDIVVLNKDYDYLKSGEHYLIENIGKTGQVSFRRPETGAGTYLTLSNLLTAQRQGVTFTKQNAPVMQAHGAENPFAKYDAEARTYGYEVRPDGAIGLDGKFPGTTVREVRGRLRVESGKGNLLFSGSPTPESFGKFLRDFWGAEKNTESKGKKAQGGSDTPSVFSLSRDGDAHADPVKLPFAIDAVTADRHVARFLSGLGASPDYHVVDFVNDLPDQVKRDAAAQNADQGNTKGVFHNGVLYVVRSNITGLKDLEKTVAHEVIGHYGLRRLFGADFINKAASLFFKMGGYEGIRDISRRNGFGDALEDYIAGLDHAKKENPLRYREAIARAILTEEVFAHLAETKPTLVTRLKALIGQVRSWLRDHGFMKLSSYGDTDILHLLNQAREAARGELNPNGDNGLSGPGATTSLAGISPADKAIYGMASDKSSAKDVLSFISKASRSPFHRQLAKLLMRTGLDTTITVGDGKGWKFDAGNNRSYAAAYSLKEDKAYLFRPGDAERHTLHELVHAATMKAIRKGGLASIQMRALFRTVQKSRQLAGMYGMENVDEFVAEAFTNPDFQRAMKQVSAPGTSGVKNAWNWLVRIIKGILGLPAKSENALSAALDLGVGLMRENMQVAAFKIKPGAAAGSATQSGATREASIRSRDSSVAGDSIVTQSRENSNDPDIRYSLDNPRHYVNSAVSRVNDYFNYPGKLSLWHKTIGTMYNLAERSPSFKKVFDSAQGFVDDVSHYASDAADHAPRWLPRLDSWKDLSKSPVGTEDNKAVAKPIFEGTLSWGRDLAGKPVPIQDLVDAAGKMDTDEKARRLEGSGNISPAMLNAWKALPLDQYMKQVESRYESKMLQPGVVWSDAELRGMFGLNDHQISLYREFREAADRSLNTLAMADMLRYGGEDTKVVRQAVMEMDNAHEAAVYLRDYLSDLAAKDPEREAHLMAMANGMIDRANKVDDLQEKGYAPLSRFGKYTVDVVDKGERQYFGLFETAREASQMAAQMKKEYGDGAVTQGTLSEEAYKLFAGVTPESLELFGNMLGLNSTGDDAQDKAFQEYLRLTKTNRSAMRRLIHRQGIAGFSQDVGRVLASFIYSNSRQTAAGLNIGDLGDAVNDIPKEQGELKDAAIKLSDYIKNPQEEAQNVRGLLFAQYLGGSVASAFVNMLQPVQVTFPWLSQFGGAKAAVSQLTKAAAQVIQKTHQFEPDLARALKVAEEDGTVSPQEIHQLMRQANGAAALRSGDGTKGGDLRAKAHNAFTRLSVAWGNVFSLAEQFNRRVTFVAAYRTAKAEGMQDPSEFARQAVKETQFIYSKANKMVWGRGAIGGTLMTFKSYSISYLELLHRMYTQGGPEGKRAVLLALGTLMLMSGASGLPFEEDLEDLLTGLGQKLGYNFNAKQSKKEFLEDVFGKDGAEIIDSGISGLPGMPMDVSGRLGLGNLIPGTGLATTKQDHTRDVLEIVGPAGDMASRMFKGAGAALDGDIGGAVSQVMPKAVSNMAKGADMANTGMYRDDKGYKVIDTSPAEAGLKAFGFQPKSVADIQESNAINQEQKSYYNLRAQEIRAKWADGIFEGDPEKVADARGEIATWNEKNPDQPMVIKINSVWRRVREMRKSKDERIADTAPKAMRAKMREDAAQAKD